MPQRIREVMGLSASGLKPALEAALSMSGDPYPRCEVACWRPLKGCAARIGVSGARVWCHYLDEGDYRAARDETDNAKR